MLWGGLAFDTVDVGDKWSEREREAGIIIKLNFVVLKRVKE